MDIQNYIDENKGDKIGRAHTKELGKLCAMEALRQASLTVNDDLWHWRPLFGDYEALEELCQGEPTESQCEAFEAGYKWALRESQAAYRLTQLKLLDTAWRHAYYTLDVPVIYAEGRLDLQIGEIAISAWTHKDRHGIRVYDLDSNEIHSVEFDYPSVGNELHDRLIAIVDERA